jgi:hypothetical protein
VRPSKGIFCHDISEIAVGTHITERPPQSGRVEARIGRRMMPTFPRPSLSFRTVGFLRYDWKAGMEGSTFPHTGRLNAHCEREYRHEHDGGEPRLLSYANLEGNL